MATRTRQIKHSLVIIGEELILTSRYMDVFPDTSLARDVLMIREWPRVGMHWFMQYASPLTSRFPSRFPLGPPEISWSSGMSNSIHPLGSVKSIKYPPHKYRSIKYPRHKIKYTHLPSSLWATGSEEAGFRRNGKRISWRRRSKSCVIVLMFECWKE